MRGKRRGAVLVIGLALATGGAHAHARTSASEAAAGTLNLQALLRLVSRLGACPPGVSATACAERTGEGLVPGLGNISEAYIFVADVGPPPCPEGLGKTRESSVRFVVATKGEIHFTLAEGAGCVGQELVRTQTQTFTVTAGTGIYSGASGSGTVERGLGGETGVGRIGQEAWKGSLNVPGLDFDTTPPALSGAVSKTVRARRGVKRVRVTYTVTARDDVDGALPATCRPTSGSRFRIGRTVVTCSATDTSGNVQTAKFTITVRRRR